jgi:indoleamine 2,3-dioxygenase
MSMDNMRFVNSFSGTDDEREFYKASAGAELRGVEILQIIEDYQNLPKVTDIASISKISKDLIRLTGIIEDISEIIQSVRASCDPHASDDPRQS